MKRTVVITTIVGLAVGGVLYVRRMFTRPYHARPFSDDYQWS